MNNRERLLDETLADETGAQFARDAAAQIRRRRALRRTCAIACAAAVVLALSLVLRQPTVSSPPPQATPAAPPLALEIISDQELVTQLEGQPVLFLKGPSGITQAILLADH